MLIEGLEGTLAGKLYLVEFDEEQWLTTPEETQRYCVDTWIKKAKPLGARWLVLRLIPDELFPLRGNDAPYIHLREPIEQAPERGYVIKGTMEVHVCSDEPYLSPVIRMSVTKAMRAYPKGTPYVIYNSAGDMLERDSVK